MIKFFTLLIFLPGTVLAEGDSIPCRPMSNIMRDIQISFRIIGKYYSKPESREKVLLSVGQMSEFFLEARCCPPNSINNLEEPSRTQKLVVFEGLIDEVREMILRLRNAILSDNNEGAESLIQMLKVKRKEGHGLFQ